MILLLDAGNTRIKWGLRKAGAWVTRGACPTGDITGLQDALACVQLRQALVCCVASASVRVGLETFLAPRVERLDWLVPAQDGHGLRNHYQPPESLGVDRYASLVAVARRGLGDCVVVSVGTALTVDALTADGQFLGGFIAPGPDLMRSALLQGTAGVRETAGVANEFPVSTGAAVAGGISLAQVGVVSAMRDRLARRCGGAVTVVLSGGARTMIETLLAPPVVVADDLVLEGLAWMVEESK